MKFFNSVNQSLINVLNDKKERVSLNNFDFYNTLIMGESYRREKQDLIKAHQIKSLITIRYGLCFVIKKVLQLRNHVLEESRRHKHSFG